MLASLALAALAQSQPTAVTYPGAVVFPAFGTAVALDDDSLVVGAREAKPCCDLAGQAFIFSRTGAGWDLALTLQAPGTDRLGFEVAVSGDVALAADFPSTMARVLVAERTAGGWARTQVLRYSGMSTINAGFGRSLAAVDGRVIVSADGGRQGTNTATGVVYVYGKVAGTWTIVQSLIPPPGSTGQIPTSRRFGSRVAVDGDLLAVTAQGNSFGGTATLGRLYIYRWDPSALPAPRYEFEAAVDAPLVSDQIWFGRDSLDVCSGRIATASTFASVQGLQHAGIAHVFEKVSGTWQETGRLEDPTPSRLGYFGHSVAISQDRVLVGRNGNQRSLFDDLPLSVEVYEKSAGGWAHARTIPDPIPGVQTGFGEALAMDGVELAAGIEGASVEREWRGGVYVGDVALGWSPIAEGVCGGERCVCPGRSTEGCGNGRQVSAAVAAFGSTSISADDLLLTATGMEPGALARVALGRAGSRPTPFGDGHLCIGNPALMLQQAVDFTGAASFGQGLVAQATQQLGAAGTIAPGETWIFQIMYSERKLRFGCATNGPPGNPSGVGLSVGRPYLVSRGFNLTNAIRVTFAP